MKKLESYAKDLGVPIYVWKDGKLHEYKTASRTEKRIKIYEKDGKEYASQVDEEVGYVDAGKEVSLNDPLSFSRDFSAKQKERFIDDSLQMKSFKVDGLEKRCFDAFNRGPDSWAGYNGYKNFISEVRDYERIPQDQKGSWRGPQISEYLEGIRGKMIGLKNKSEKGERESEEELIRIVFSLYGFAEAAKEDGNIEFVERTLMLINEFGSVEECQRVMSKRKDKDGGFKILDEDLPLEVRKKVEAVRSGGK